MELMSKGHSVPRSHQNKCTQKVTSSSLLRGDSGGSSSAQVPATVMFTVKLRLQGWEPPTEATG